MLSSDSESCHDQGPKREGHIDEVETSQQQIPQLIGEGECKDRIILGNDGKSPSKKASKEKSSQKPTDVEGHTPVKGKKTKGSAKERGMKWVNFGHIRCNISLLCHICGFEMWISDHFVHVVSANRTGSGDVEAEEEETAELVEPNVPNVIIISACLGST